MNTPRLRTGGGIASSSSLVLLVLVRLYNRFVCDAASELERWALLPFRGFPALTPASCFSELAVFTKLLHIFSQVLGLSPGLFYFFSVRYFRLACDHGNSFLCLEE